MRRERPYRLTYAIFAGAEIIHILRVMTLLLARCILSMAPRQTAFTLS